MPNVDPSAPWAIVIHGGAGVIERDAMSAEREAGIRAGLMAALEAGAALLRGGWSALDAVEAAVRALEDDPQFNAGRGAVFSADGVNELDASIMDGATRRVGAVAGVRRTRNPVSLARAVMEDGHHVLLAGAGADAFGAANSLSQADPEYFRTEERWRQYEELAATQTFDRSVRYGTVGAVARDDAGHLAAATSTGGLTGKKWGRVGDSPVPGAGIWADDRSVAVSATGSGEAFLRLAVAHEIDARVRLTGVSPLAAAQAVTGAELAAVDGSGGVIVMGREGPGVWAFNSAGMYRARMDAAGTPEIAFYGDGEP